MRAVPALSLIGPWDIKNPENTGFSALSGVMTGLRPLNRKNHGYRPIRLHEES
jgi:hypothetical protein